jgi:hypothetical protein
MMSEAVALEFDFPRFTQDRKQSRIARVFHLAKRLKAVMEKEGTLFPLMLAAKALDVGRTRMDELVADGRIKRVEVDGHVFVTEMSVVEYARQEVKNGRPLKNLESTVSFRECVRMSREMRSEALQKK